MDVWICFVQYILETISNLNSKNMKIKQHIPNYCSGIESQIDEFSNLKELKNIKWVNPRHEDENFYRFSISEKFLMAEYNEGYDWYVVGYLDEPIDWLPKWEAKHKK